MPVAPAAKEFQGALTRLVAEPAPLGLRLWPVLAATLLLCLIAMAALLRLDIVVTASGRLVTQSPPVLLQPLTRAVLREMRVAPGDVVSAGQVLARLDPTLAQADLSALLVERRALTAEIARLQAELSGAKLGNDSPDLVLQGALRDQRSALTRARRTELEADLAALRQERRLLLDMGPQLRERLDIAREVEAMREGLAARQSGSMLAALEARAARLAAETATGQHRIRLSDLDQQIRSAEAGLQAFDSDIRRQIAEALASRLPRLSQLDEMLAKAERLAALTEMVAPQDAVVLSVAAGGPGSVMEEGVPVVVLVPTDVPLVAEIAIPSADVGRLGPELPVQLKIDAFPWRQHGMLAGRLSDVGRASFAPDGAAQSFHPGRVELAEAEAVPAIEARLLPGMTLTADIRTGTRSVLEYFLDPLLRGLGESLREP